MIFFGIVLVIFLIVCIFLILLVLIQSDKGGGLSGAIGGGLSGASALLGTQDTANILSRGTTLFAVAYMVLCILLSLFLSRMAAPAMKSELKKMTETQSFSPAAALQGGLLPMKEDDAAQQQGDVLPLLPEEE